MIRKPVVANQFYPGDPGYLEETINGYLEEVKRESVIGAVVPHAGYIYSGKTAGALYSRIAPKLTYIILGPNHTGYGDPFSIVVDGIWQTPLGDVEIDFELANHILKNSQYLRENQRAHQYEHSIEVQLPFLQVITDGRFQFIPICISHFDVNAYKTLGHEIANAIKTLKKDVTIIVSSDMTHYETHESASRKDKKAIDAIVALDENMLLERVCQLEISMCGYVPTVVMLTAAKELGATRGELIKYTTSGEVSGDYRQVVGYASIIIQ